MAYNHRIATQEMDTGLSAPVSASAGLRVIVGTAPINLAEDAAPANTPVLVNSFAEAVQAFGYSSDYEKYTLCESMDSSFKVFNVAPAILINVLDPANSDFTTAINEQVEMTAREGTVSGEGALKDGLEVYTSHTGYTPILNPDAGDNPAAEGWYEYTAATHTYALSTKTYITQTDTTAFAEVSTEEVEPDAGDNPAEKGWYEYTAAAHTYVLTTDNAPETGTVYVTLTATAVTPERSASPAAEGWYESDGSDYTASADTYVNTSKTYYRYGTIQDTMEEGTDYVLSFNAGNELTITMLSGSQYADVASVSVSGRRLNPDGVDKMDIVGGYDSSTGKETGIEAVRQIYPKLGMVPGLLLAPGFSSEPEVAAALVAKCLELNGLFPVMCVCDLDTDVCRKYTDVGQAKAALGVTSPQAVVCWPKVAIGDVIYNYSTIWAAMAAQTDYSHGDVPYKSPSNESLGVSGAVLADGTEVLLDIPQAEVVNGFGVVTAINDSGWRSYGNCTAAYPGTTDPKDRWIACRRMMNWYRNHFILSYKDRVDEPADYRLIESLVISENIYFNSLAAQGVIAGGNITFDEDENPVTQILGGKIIFHTRIAFYTPAEYILNVIEFDPTILSAALGG